MSALAARLPAAASAAAHGVSRAPVAPRNPARTVSASSLSVSQPGDAHEHEAGQVAERVLAAPSGSGSGEARPVSPQVVVRPAAMAAMPESVAPAIADPGQALAPPLRGDMEQRFGCDFSAVRVHRGDAAGRSAGALGARAYTLGHHVVFGAGQYRPHTPSGRRLVAHELAHVMQQSRSAQPRIDREVGDEGHAAETAAHEEGAAEEGGSYADRMIQAAIEEAAIEMAHLMRGAMPVFIPETILAALVAAEVSFMHRSYQRLVERGEGMRILGRVREFIDPRTAAEFCVRFVWGVIKGLVSPITGLVHLGIGAVQLTTAALGWLERLPQSSPALLAEAVALRDAMTTFGVQASAELTRLAERSQLLGFAGAIFEAASTASDSMERQLVHGAQVQGRRAADSLVTYFLESPLPELGELAGEIVGTVVIELVLLLFTDGIGNLITKLGEFARALRPLSRGATAFLDVAMVVGRLITQIEHMIGVLLSRTVLRPLMPLFQALEPLLGRMRQFAQRLVGAGEESALALARAGTGALEETAAVTTRTAERTGAGAVPRRPAAPRRTTPPPEPVRVEPTPEPLRVEPTPEPVAPTPDAPVSGPPRTPPPVEPPTGGGPGGGDRRPLRTATAEGEGSGFSHEYIERPMPPVERGRATGEPVASSTDPVPVVEAPPVGEGSRRSSPDVEEDIEFGPVDRGSPSDPSELNAPMDRTTASDEFEGLPVPERPRPVIGSPESLEAARQAGVPDEVLDGTVLTGRDFADVVPDAPLQAARPAPELPPLADELERGVAGRRPTTAPDPRDVQHTELWGDIELTTRNIEQAGGRVNEVAINRRQRIGPAEAPEAASRRARPDAQLAVVDAELNGRRIVIEYDRAPGTRAMDHARGVLMRDPNAIVILKIIGFD